MNDPYASPSPSPGTVFDGSLRRGDRLVRFAPYEGILHSAVVVSERIESAASLLRRGVPVEAAGSGGYVEVAEMPPDGGDQRLVGRLLTDAWGRLARGQTIVRANPRPVAGTQPPTGPAATPASGVAAAPVPQPLLTEPAPADPEPATEPTTDEPLAEAPAPAAGTFVKTTSDPDEIIVTLADGARYHVRRKVRSRVVRLSERPQIGAFWNDERVFGRLTWCEGTQGTIEIGANLPAAARRLFDTVIGQINRRAGPEEIARTLESAPVQTFVELAITKDKSWRFLGDFKLELNPAGVVSKSAAVSFDKGPFKVGVEYKDDGTGKQVRVTFDVPLGRRTISGRKCEQRELMIWWDAECLREQTSKDIVPVPGHRVLQETLYLYFEYMSDLLRRDPKAKTDSPEVLDEILNDDPKLGTAVLNKRTLQRLDYLVGQGYWLDSFKGYASPEGRRGPAELDDRGAARTWVGNVRLSERRANKALKLLRDRYEGRSLRMRDLPPRMRFAPGKAMPSAVGLSEFPRLDLAAGVELEDAALDRVMVHGSLNGREFKFECSPKGTDTGPFVDQCPQEKARLTERDLQFVTDPSRSDRQRAERLFENLRRVEVHLVKHEKSRGITVSTTSLVTERDCPKPVMDAAFGQWGTRVMFTRPDPPAVREASR